MGNEKQAATNADPAYPWKRLLSESRPLAWFVLGAFALVALWGPLHEPLMILARRAESLEAAGLHVKLERAAKEGGFENELRELEKLDMTELNVFLAIGGLLGSEAIVAYPKMPRARFEQITEKLEKVGFQRIDHLEDGKIQHTPTEKGLRLHKVITDHLYCSVRPPPQASPCGGAFAPPGPA